MKLNMKSQRKQTHNTVLMELGVSGLICINSQKEIVSITIGQKGPALFLSSNFIFIQTSTCWNFNRSRSFFGYKKKEIKRFNSLSLSSFGRMEHLPSFELWVLKIEQRDTCHYLVPETCPFACSVQVTHLSTNWAINLECSA